MITPPDTFTARAYVPVYNEADILEATLRRLVEGGLQVTVIDNWSTDGSYELACNMAARHADLTVSRFPATPPQSYDWQAILKHIEYLYALDQPEWGVRNDADEVLMSPWRGVNLRTALWRAHQAGATVVPFRVLQFHPIDNNFQPGMDPVSYFRHYMVDMTTNERAWHGSEVAIQNGGHNVWVQARRVFAIPCLLLHYPIRSQMHGVRKILRERLPRYNAAERRMGWHVHYNYANEATQFVRDPTTLNLYNEQDWLVDE